MISSTVISLRKKFLGRSLSPKFQWKGYNGCMLVGDLHTVDILLMTSQPGGLRGNLQISIRAFFFTRIACVLHSSREGKSVQRRHLPGKID